MSAGWKQRLQRSLHLCRSKPQARFFQLATVDAQGMPNNRTVVFRGFEQDTDNLWIVTDIRSDKVSHLLENRAFSLAWYFVKTREQYRINGKAEIWVQDARHIKEVFASASTSTTVLERDVSAYWKQLSDPSKQQFYWPHPKQAVSEPSAGADLANISAYFAVVCLTPEHVQYLDLKPSPQCRELYAKDGPLWLCQAVNP